MRVALVTDRLRPGLTHDDRRLIPAFDAAGVQASAAIWSDPTIDWARFDAVIVRSPWDYHHDLGAFRAWIDAREPAGKLINPAPLLRWNADKSYLEDLAKRGAPVAATERIVAGTDGLRPLVDRWGRIVVKPAVSAAGKDTWRADPANVEEIERALADHLGEIFLVQPYLAAIEAEGELSLVFFAGVYSHAVRKRAAPGGFLIHEEHRGTLRRAFPSPRTVAAAAAIVALVDDPVYARVDVVEDGDRVWLIELELIEPELFVRFDNAAPGRFVAAVLTAIGPKRR